MGNGVALVSPLPSCNKCTVHSCLSKTFGNVMCIYQSAVAELVFQNTLKCLLQTAREAKKLYKFRNQFFLDEYLTY